MVAPHEFFLLGQGTERLTPEFLSSADLFLAEQPGSRYFATCLWLAQHARGVLDINPLTALAWDDLGFRARALPLGFVDGFAPYADRIDVRGAPAYWSLPPEARWP